jgi:hypothetical protein
MPLGEEMDWGQVGAIPLDAVAGTKVADAFQLMFGPPSKDLLLRCLKIYKLNGYPNPLFGIWACCR